MKRQHTNGTSNGRHPADPSPSATAGRNGHAPGQAAALPALLLISEVAALLRLSRRSVERMAARRLIPGRVELPGRAVRYRTSAVLKWLEEGCPASRAKAARG